MKKFLSCIIATLLCSATWAGYGILVNGCDYYAAEAAGEYEGFQQFLAKVQIKSGDYCQLYDESSQAAWMCNLNQYSVKGFTKNGNQLDCSVAGNYDFYIKLKYQQDELYVGAGSTATTPVNLCPTTGFCIAGNGEAGNPWCCGLAWDSAGCPLGESNTKTFEAVPAGKYMFKITNGTWKQSWGGASVDANASTKGYVTDGDGNVAFTTQQVANITITFDGKKIVLVSTQPFAPMWSGSSVPSQCTDVLLQGFYYDSYEVDTAHAGTELYGDTKWKTLLAQAGELSASFDLIWLPPSSYASGTGYHPKQYSNQNSDWGSRTDLSKLIKALHAGGTKVVADIVINHTEAMASWCDFASLNFGSYGTFQPDGSYICNTDELNWNTPEIKKEAGKCWGTATGKEDDGENWDGARDWSHSEVYVQEMFKAYLQWLRNEIGYDGWRYDKGDGFHNWHMWNYNQASEPYIAFMECWKGTKEIKSRIDDAKKDVMAFDFQNMYLVYKNEGIQKGSFASCGINGKEDWGDGAGLVHEGYRKNAVTFVDNHDMFLRNEQEFCGYGNSLKPANKTKLLQANAHMLSMPGVPCVFYPHWYVYKAELKAMINARRVAGVHSESVVKEEEVSGGGYKATVEGKNGILIITLGDKTIQEATGSNKWLAENGYQKMASGTGYAMWVKNTADVAARLVMTPECAFEDSTIGMSVTMQVEGGSNAAATKIYYTTDGTTPSTASAVYNSAIQITRTTVVKAIAVTGTAQSEVYSCTYTYREPLKHGITIRFDKPDEWDKVYYYAWVPGVDEKGNPTAENIMGAFPGQRIYQAQDGWYTYEFDQSLDTIHFCISSGVDCGALNVRSNDLEATYDAYYAWEEDHEAEDKNEKLLEDPEPLNPEFDLVISPETGNFRDLTEGQRVQLTVIGHEGASIYYTTDGSDPYTSANPAMDTVSFVVKQTTTVRAYAQYSPDKSTVIKTPEYTNVYTYKAPQTGPITVRFIQPNEYVVNEKGDTIAEPWKDLYLYAFTRVKVGGKFKDTPYALDGKSSKWPGMKWTTTVQEGGYTWHTWTMKPEIKEIYVIFTEGDKKPQTQDIYLTENMCYLWNPYCWKAVENQSCDGKTDVAELTAMPELENNKFIYEGQLYIQVGEKVYDIFGRNRTR